MRIRLLQPLGANPKGAEIEVNYTIGANLVYYGFATEIADNPVKPAVAGMDFPTADKMIHRGRPRKKQLEHQSSNMDNPR